MAEFSVNDNKKLNVKKFTIYENSDYLWPIPLRKVTNTVPPQHPHSQSTLPRYQKFTKHRAVSKETQVNLPLNCVDSKGIQVNLPIQCEEDIAEEKNPRTKFLSSIIQSKKLTNQLLCFILTVMIIVMLSIFVIIIFLSK